MSNSGKVKLTHKKSGKTHYKTTEEADRIKKHADLGKNFTYEYPKVPDEVKDQSTVLSSPSTDKKKS